MTRMTPSKRKPVRRLYSRIAPLKIPELPHLSAPPKGGHYLLTITIIQVYDKPWYREAGTQWITATRPTKPVGEGDLVCLAVNRDRHTGIGRITHIANIDKHWVTFNIAGATPKASIRVPIPWAKIPVHTAEEHAKSFRALENVPPHCAFRANPKCRDPNVNPYLSIEATQVMNAHSLGKMTPQNGTYREQRRSEDRRDAKGKSTRPVASAEMSS